MCVFVHTHVHASMHACVCARVCTRVHASVHACVCVAEVPRLLCSCTVHVVRWCDDL